MLSKMLHFKLKFPKHGHSNFFIGVECLQIIKENIIFCQTKDEFL